jgi:hypothetical protein
MKLPTDVVMSVCDLVNSMQPNTVDAYEQLKVHLRKLQCCRRCTLTSASYHKRVRRHRRRCC